MGVEVAAAVRKRLRGVRGWAVYPKSETLSIALSDELGVAFGAAELSAAEGGSFAKCGAIHSRCCEIVRADAEGQPSPEQVNDQLRRMRGDVSQALFRFRDELQRLVTNHGAGDGLGHLLGRLAFAPL